MQTPLPTLASLFATLVLAACGGGGSGPAAAAPAPPASSPTGGAQAQELSCDDFATVEVAGMGRLINNTWNKAAAGSFAVKQCLIKRESATAVSYGWSWSWPANSNDVYAYPAIMVGWKPWDGGSSNHASLPARIASVKAFRWAYDIALEGSGKTNLSTSLWITRTGATSATPNRADIANEIMIWTAGQGFQPGGQLIATTAIGGRSFEVWYAKDWGDASGANSNKWNYIAYRATTQTSSTTLDMQSFVADAVARGLVDPQHFISSIELGSEIMSGSGSAWINSLSLTIE